MVLLFRQRRDFLRELVGVVYAAGLWMFIDGVLYYQTQNRFYTFYGYEWIPGFCSMLASLIANTLSFDEVFGGGGEGEEEEDDGSSYSRLGAWSRRSSSNRCGGRKIRGFKLFLFIACYTVMAMSIAGAFWIWFAVFCGSCWIGIAIMLQTVMNTLASFVYIFWKPISSKLH